MSERTTIGGTVYESIGSSSSNLLLKCNGTARIQWGNKLIDLIKNGKIASGNSDTAIYIISDKSEMKSDGIYVINTEFVSELWVIKNGNTYNLTGTDLYISASKKQDITVEQKKQALENIGMYYNTLKDVENSGIQNGIVYVLDNKNLYTIKNGVIEEFEAKVKTVTVEQEEEEGEVINSSFKIVLSVFDEEYLVLENKRILANYPLYIKDTASVCSESATDTTGYRLYMDGNVSCLDVDKITVRQGLPSNEYIEVTYEQLILNVSNKLLIPSRWYLITDFQNHWKLPVYNIEFNRPILIRALSNCTFYEEGELFKDRRVKIHYDYTYNQLITQIRQSTEVAGGSASIEEVNVNARGRITWMKDAYGNEANFDFLDYTDANGIEIAKLHKSIEDPDYLDKSIFPKFSYNNILTTYNLYGTVINYNQDTEKYVIDDSNTVKVEFIINDDTIKNQEDAIEIHDNQISCHGFTLSENEVEKFYGNILNNLYKVDVKTDIINSTIEKVYTLKELSESEPTFTFDNPIYSKLEYTNLIVPIENTYIQELANSQTSIPLKNNTFGKINKSTFTNSNNAYSIENNVFGDIDHSLINNTITNSTFKNITYSKLLKTIDNSNFDNISGKIENGIITYTVINSSIQNSTFENIECCNLTIQEFSKVQFRNIKNTTIESDDDTLNITNVNWNSNIDPFYIPFTIDNSNYPLLFDSSKIKETYFIKGSESTNDNIQITIIKEQTFFRGMIVMHSGLTSIPEGWALCDGKEYEYDGIKTKTPDLRGKFIKSIQYSDDQNINLQDLVGETKNPNLNDKGEIQLKEEYLPKHSHPHDAHTHSLSELTGTIQNSGNLTSTFDDNNYIYSITQETVKIQESDEGVEVIKTLTVEDQGGSTSGSNHTHDITISGGTLSSATSQEVEKQWPNKAFNIEPHYYSLIFIIKL